MDHLYKKLFHHTMKYKKEFDSWIGFAQGPFILKQTSNIITVMHKLMKYSDKFSWKKKRICMISELVFILWWIFDKPIISQSNKWLSRGKADKTLSIMTWNNIYTKSMSRLTIMSIPFSDWITQRADWVYALWAPAQAVCSLVSAKDWQGGTAMQRNHMETSGQGNRLNCKIIYWSPYR